MDENKLRIKLLENNKTLNDLAIFLDISIQSVYQKINGTSEPTRKQIRLTREFLHLSDGEVIDIFLL